MFIEGPHHQSFNMFSEIFQVMLQITCSDSQVVKYATLAGAPLNIWLHLVALIYRVMLRNKKKYN